MTGGSGFLGAHLVRALVARGDRVRVPVRTQVAAARVRGLGARPVFDESWSRGLALVFHTAERTTGPHRALYEANVTATARLLTAVGGARLVHVSSDAAVQTGAPLRQATECAPLQPDSPSAYGASKARAEQLVHAADLDAVVVRPRLLWGPGDPVLLPGLLDAVRHNRFAWVDGGRHLTDTTHVANAVHGLLLAADRGHRGETYFVTDDDPVAYRHFVADLLAAEGLAPEPRTLHPAQARTLALGRDPLAHWQAAHECTLDLSKSRAHLGYRPRQSRPQALSGLRSFNTAA